MRSESDYSAAREMLREMLKIVIWILLYNAASSKSFIMHGGTGYYALRVIRRGNRCGSC